MVTNTNHSNDIQTRPAQVQLIEPGAEWQTAKHPKTFLAYRCEIRLVAEELGYSTYVAQLPGAISQGDSVELAIKNTVEAIQECIRTYEDNNMPIPWVDPQKSTSSEDCFWVEVNV